MREKALGAAREGEWLEHRAGDLLEEARDYLGAPYEWGGMTSAGIDCSGLIHMAFRRLGVLVPRDSWQQEAAGAEIAEENLRPGDVVCYEGTLRSGSATVESCTRAGERASSACSRRPSRVS